MREKKSPSDKEQVIEQINAEGWITKIQPSAFMIEQFNINFDQPFSPKSSSFS